MQNYIKLEKIFSEISVIEEIAALLSWDNAVMMPDGGSASRSEHLAYLKSSAHKLITSKNLPELLEKSASEDLDAWQKANLREMNREYIHQNALDEKLVAAFSKASHESEMIWREARKDNDYKRFLPYFERLVAIVKEISAIKSQKLGLGKYDAMLDLYDPGTRSAQVDMVFSQLKAKLPALTDEIIAKQKYIIPIEGNFAIDKQKELGLHVMKLLGFDFNHGRLDVSHHPFCGGIPGDVRLTTRYREDEFLSAFMGILHETGHAIYENNLPHKWRNQPVGKARGMSTHESQSLLFEMQLACSRDFCDFVSPIIQQYMGVEIKDLFAMVNQVERSLIRVDADEVTYPMHVIIRYEIEKEIIENGINLKELPEIWNEKMRQYLDISPDSDKNGCMQDIHWPGGDFGYFPTYSLGAIKAAQFFHKAKSVLPSDDIQKGKFTRLNEWLHDEIHSKASFYETDELLKKVTGEDLNVDIYFNYLKEKYIA